MFYQKNSPNDKDAGSKYAEKSLNKTEIVRLEIIKCSGKCKDLKTSELRPLVANQ
jgi:hypothetical protein